MAKERRIFIWIFLLSFIIIAIFYAFPSQSTGYASIRDLLYLWFPAVTLITGLRTSYFFGLKSELGGTFFLISLGFGLFFIGDTIFYLLEYVFKTSPYPSVADISYIAGYFFIFAGIIREIVYLKLYGMGKRWALFFLPVIVLSIFIYIVLFSLRLTSQSSFLESAVAGLYAIDDVLLIIGCFFILRLVIFFKGKTSLPWLYLSLGMVAMFAADMLYAFFSMQYNQGLWLYRLIDLVFIASYILVAYGVLEAKFFLQDMRAKPSLSITS